MTTASTNTPVAEVPEWVRLYKFYFKFAPTDEDTRTWTNEIRAAIRNVQRGEVAQAIRSLGERFYASVGMKEPAGGQIIAEIKRLRRGEHNVVTTKNRVLFYRDGALQETSMLDLKRLLEHHPDHQEAWSIICCPLDIEQCRELQRFCDNNAIIYERFIPPEPYAVKRIAEGFGKA